MRHFGKMILLAYTSVLICAVLSSCVYSTPFPKETTAATEPTTVPTETTAVTTVPTASSDDRPSYPTVSVDTTAQTSQTTVPPEPEIPKQTVVFLFTLEGENGTADIVTGDAFLVSASGEQILCVPNEYGQLTANLAEGVYTLSFYSSQTNALHISFKFEFPDSEEDEPPEEPSTFVYSLTKRDENSGNFQIGRFVQVGDILYTSDGTGIKRITSQGEEILFELSLPSEAELCTDGHTLYVCGADKTVYSLDLNTLSSAAVLSGTSGEISLLSADDHTIRFSDESGIKTYPFDSGTFSSEKRAVRTFTVGGVTAVLSPVDDGSGYVTTLYGKKGNTPLMKIRNRETIPLPDYFLGTVSTSSGSFLYLSSVNNVQELLLVRCENGDVTSSTVLMTLSSQTFTYEVKGFLLKTVFHHPDGTMTSHFFDIRTGEDLSDLTDLNRVHNLDGMTGYVLDGQDLFVLGCEFFVRETMEIPSADDPEETQVFPYLQFFFGFPVEKTNPVRIYYLEDTFVFTYENGDYFLYEKSF